MLSKLYYNLPVVSFLPFSTQQIDSPAPLLQTTEKPSIWRVCSTAFSIIFHPFLLLYRAIYKPIPQPNLINPSETHKSLPYSIKSSLIIATVATTIGSLVLASAYSKEYFDPPPPLPKDSFSILPYLVLGGALLAGVVYIDKRTALIPLEEQDLNIVYTISASVTRRKRTKQMIQEIASVFTFLKAPLSKPDVAIFNEFFEIQKNIKEKILTNTDNWSVEEAAEDRICPQILTRYTYLQEESKNTVKRILNEFKTQIQSLLKKDELLSVNVTWAISENVVSKEDFEAAKTEGKEFLQQIESALQKIESDLSFSSHVEGRKLAKTIYDAVNDAMSPAHKLKSFFNQHVRLLKEAYQESLIQLSKYDLERYPKCAEEKLWVEGQLRDIAEYKSDNKMIDLKKYKTAFEVHKSRLEDLLAVQKT